MLSFVLVVLFLDIHIRSEGCNDTRITPGTRGVAYIKVNGKDYSPHGRGHNVVIVDGNTGKAERCSESYLQWGIWDPSDL